MVVRRTWIGCVIGLLSACSDASGDREATTAEGSEGHDDGAFGTSGAGDTSRGTTGGDTTGGGDGLVLRGGWIVDPAGETVEQRDLYLCDGRIVDPEQGSTCAGEEIDVTGKWVIPALRDMHVHARGISLGDGSFRDKSPAAEAALFRRAGVTAFLDSMSDESVIFPARDDQRASDEPGGADIYCCGGAFTPTGGHGTEYGLPTSSYHIVDTPTQAEEQLAALAERAPDVIKVFYDHRGPDGGPDVADGEAGVLGVAMDHDVMLALVGGAQTRGLTTQVHIGTWNDARDAIEAGATAIAHLGETAIPPDVLDAAAAHEVFWIPTQMLYRGLTEIVDTQALLDDPLLAAVAGADVIDSYRDGQRDVEWDYLDWLARHDADASNVAALHQAGIRLLAGTDTIELGTFIGWSLHRELAAFVAAGLTPMQALATASVNAGDFLGRDFGIQPGAEASVVVLSASPIDDIRNTTTIERVIHHGRVVFP